ncbi:unnamed protein product, partial [Phaeothamnion confervicola]
GSGGGNGGGGGSIDAAMGGNSRPRRAFMKKDLVDAVQKMGWLCGSASAPELSAASMLASAAGPSLVASQGGGGNGPGSCGADDIEVGGQLRVMETGVNTTSRRFNDLRLRGDRAAADLQRRLTVLRALELETEALQRMRSGRTSESGRIRELGIRIAAAEREAHQQVHRRRILDHMRRRLVLEQAALSAELNARDEGLRTARKELRDVQALSRQLHTGRTRALLELAAAQRAVDTEQRDRGRTLTAKETAAATARRMEGWRADRERTRARMAQSLRGDLTAEKEREVLRTLAEKERAAEAERAAADTARRRIADAEAALARVQQAVGVGGADDDLAALVAKVAGQGASRAALEEERRDAEARLAAAKAAKEALERAFAAARAGGGGGATELNRDVADEVE